MANERTATAPVLATRFVLVDSLHSCPHLPHPSSTGIAHRLPRLRSGFAPLVVGGIALPRLQAARFLPLPAAIRDPVLAVHLAGTGGGRLGVGYALVGRLRVR